MKKEQGWGFGWIEALIPVLFYEVGLVETVCYLWKENGGCGIMGQNVVALKKG